MTPQNIAKRAAGAGALDTFVETGMTLGLGSGSTSHWFVRVLGERVKEGLEVVGISTSTGTSEVAREVGVPLSTLDDVDSIDLTVDGADEIDPAFRMIKGGGASLLWEKIVAQASKRVITVVDETKVVDRLGAYPLPVEIATFGWRSTARQVERTILSFGVDACRIDLRGGIENPLVTDGGHHLLDCHIGSISHPEELSVRLNQIPGVMENGLFNHEAHGMVIGKPDGTAEILMRG